MEIVQEKQVGKVMRHAGLENDRTVDRQLGDSLRGYFFFAAQRVSCEFHEGVVILRGHVGSFHEKQMAQELARRVDGVKMVVNRLVVDANATSEIILESVPSARSSEPLATAGK